MLLCYFVLFLFLLSKHNEVNAAGRDPNKISYRGWKVAKVTPANSTQLRLLRSTQGQHGVNFLREPSHLNQTLQMLLSPTRADGIIKHLQSANLTVEVLVQDLQRLIREERKQMMTKVYPQGDYRTFKLDSYHSYEEIDNFLHDVQRQNPSVASLIVIGNSTEKRKMFTIKVGKPSDGPKPAIWVDAGVHAREWVAPATALYVIYKLVSEYEKNSQFKEMLDTMDWYVTPLANPDGYEYSRNVDRVWRKTRSRNQCHFWTCCYGTDMNRNFGHHWGTSGTSTNPCSDVYRGPRPFSEPESQAIRDFLLGHNKTIHAYVTLHSFSQMWLIPFGYGSPPLTPDDFGDLKSLAEEGAKSLLDVHGSVYRVGNSARLLYPASGAADDWAKGYAKIKYAYTLELRPSDDDISSANGFILDRDQILPTAEEVFAGLLTVARKVKDSY